MTVVVATGSHWRTGLRQLCPMTSGRPRTSWLASITVLWALLWLQLALFRAPWSQDLAFALFAVACADTSCYGMTLRPRQLRAPGDQGVLASAAVAVGILAAVSWAAVIGLGAEASVTYGSVGPLFVVVIFGSPVSLTLAIVGYLLMVTLLGAGYVLGAGARALRRRSHTT